MTLNLSDLKTMYSIIKTVSTRGAIQAEEMLTVGTLYKKLGEFILEMEKTELPKEASEGNNNNG